MSAGSRASLWTVLGMVAVLLATAAVYHPGLDGPLVLDDFSNLRPVAAVDDGFWREAVFSNESGPLGRPLSMLTFALNRFTTGDDVAAMKATNLGLHLLGGILIFGLSLRLLKETPLQRRHAAALWIAAAWLLAPLFASTVLYVVQRMTQLAALAMLGGLLSYVAGRQMTDRHPRAGAALVTSAFVFWTPAAMLCKENGALLPLLAATVEAFFFRLRGSRNTRRYLLALYLAFLALPAIAGATHFLPKLATFEPTAAGRSFTPLERGLTEARILFDYARQLFTPQPAGLGVYHDDYRLSRGLLDPPATLAALGGLVLIGAAAAYSLIRGRHRPLAFGALFFLAGHALESTVFMLEPYFEHRNYLPGFGLLFAAGYLIFRLMEQRPRLHGLLIATAVIMPLGHASMTYGQAHLWSSTPDLLSNAVAHHPDSLRVHTDAAVFHARHGAIERARQHAGKARQLAGEDALSLALLPVIIHCTAGSTPPRAFYTETLRRDLAGTPDRDFGHYLEVIADMAVAGHCSSIDLGALAAELDTAVQQQRVKLDTVGWKHRAWIGKIVAEAGDFDRALAYAEAAEMLAKDVPVPAFMALHYRIKLGDILGARDRLRRIQARFGGQGDRVAANIVFYQQLLDHAAADPSAGDP